MLKFEIFYGNSYEEALGKPGVLVNYPEYLQYLKNYAYIIVSQDDEETFAVAEDEYFGVV